MLQEERCFWKDLCRGALRPQRLLSTTSALLVSFKLSVHSQICLSWPRRQRLITRCERHVDVKRSNPKAFHSTFVAHTLEDGTVVLFFKC